MRAKPLILVVDDVEDNRKIVCARLEANNYDVLLAVDGVDALEKTRRHLPDLILLDVMMPRLGGVETVRRLKADPSIPFIPVVLLTAKSDVKDVVEGLQAGADDYLTKPIEHTALVARVAAMLRIKMLQDRVTSQSEKLARQARELDGWNRTLERRVAEQIQELDRMSRLKRFLPPQIAEALLAAKDGESVLDSHRADITVLFCDLRDFTSFSVVSKPDDVMSFLREYHAVIGEAIFAHGGTLERFTGDSIMAFFNDPTPCAGHCLRGARLALAIRAEYQKLLERWGERGVGLGLGIGIAAGYATLGRIGFEKRIDYAAIGPVTNLASRICSAAAGGQILVCSRVASEIESQLLVRNLGDLALKGFSQPVTVYELAEGPRYGEGASESPPP